MKYKDMLIKLWSRKYIARLPHWKPDVWIKCDTLDGETKLFYDDGEEFEPSMSEEKSTKWEVIQANNLEEYMKSHYDFARMITLKVMSTRQVNYIHRLNHRLMELYMEKNALVHRGGGYSIVLEDGEWQAKKVSSHWIPTLIRASNKEIVEEAIVKYEALLNSIGELNGDLCRVRFDIEIKIEELIELYRLYK